MSGPIMRENDFQASFASELGEVLPRLQAALEDLYSPLGELARAHLRDIQPPVRAAVVLAAGLGEPDSERLREQRILLATALEMLAVALSVHKLLLVAAADNSLDKSLVGSTILTGDYCFSRAAVFAAATESPVVVDLFSRALKTVSEGHLRQLLNPDAPPFDETVELTQAGVRAVAHLAALPPQETARALELARRAAAGLLQGAPELDALPPSRRVRWQAAADWLAAPASVSPH